MGINAASSCLRDGCGAFLLQMVSRALATVALLFAVARGSTEFGCVLCVGR